MTALPEGSKGTVGIHFPSSLLWIASPPSACTGQRRCPDVRLRMGVAPDIHPLLGSPFWCVGAQPRLRPVAAKRSALPSPRWSLQKGPGTSRRTSDRWFGLERNSRSLSFFLFSLSFLFFLFSFCSIFLLLSSFVCCLLMHIEFTLLPRFHPSVLPTEISSLSLRFPPPFLFVRVRSYLDVPSP